MTHRSWIDPKACLKCLTEVGEKDYVPWEGYMKRVCPICNPEREYKPAKLYPVQEHNVTGKIKPMEKLK